jgi:16S rRNA (cytosine1402-N4)-methyltransferase
MNDTVPHIPVLLDEVLDLFAAMPEEGVFVDCTLGFGGHSEAILKAHPGIRLIGIDQDPEALDFATRRLAPFGDRFETRRGRFSEVLPALADRPIVGILADFGVSSLQLDKKARGFSFQSDRLDMRMDPGRPKTAWDVVNGYSQVELERIFLDYAEERRYKKAAAAIVQARRNGPIETGIELSEILGRVLPKRGKTNPATALFQEIRIEVNDELGEITRLLDTLETMRPAGAVAGLITFHSLEDRLVKQRFKSWATSCICPPESFRCVCGNNHAIGTILTKKPLTAKPKELQANARSRSAKLRAFRFENR